MSKWTVMIVLMTVKLLEVSLRMMILRRVKERLWRLLLVQPPFGLVTFDCCCLGELRSVVKLYLLLETSCREVKEMEERRVVHRKKEQQMEASGEGVISCWKPFLKWE